jgi:GGDEF domain-containing protein
LAAKINAQSNDLGAGVFLAIEVSGFHELRVTYGHGSVDEVLKHVAQRAQLALGVADILFRAATNQFIAFLGVADRKTADSVADNIRRNVSDFGFSIGGNPIFLQVQVTALSLPKDIDALSQLLSLDRSPSLGLPKSTKSLVH